MNPLTGWMIMAKTGWTYAGAFSANGLIIAASHEQLCSDTDLIRWCKTASSFIALMRQDVVMAWRENQPVFPWIFMIAGVDTFWSGADLKLLRDIAPGLVWVALLLAVLLSLGYFSADLEEEL